MSFTTFPLLVPQTVDM